MPSLSRWYVRLAFINLFIGITFGALILIQKGVNIFPQVWRLLPAHIELLLLGWIVQLTMGVAFWITPRFWKPPRRGNETGAWIAFPLLNAGVWLVVMYALLNTSILVLTAGRLLELTAVVAFSLHLWQRIVGRDFQPR